MTRKIATHYYAPPVPFRNMDWSAFYEGEEEAGHYGWGATEEEAIADFEENYAADHRARLGWQEFSQLLAQPASVKP